MTWARSGTLAVFLLTPLFVGCGDRGWFTDEYLPPPPGPMAPLYLKMVSSTWVDGIPERLAQIQPGASKCEVMDRLGRARALNGHLLTTAPMPGGRIRSVHELIEHNDDWTMVRHRYDLELVYSRTEPNAEWRFVSGRLIEAGSWESRVN